MSEHDYDIANQLSANLRIDLNNALKALNSNNSGVTEPSTTFANMLWYDTTSKILKMKPEDNAAGQWISIGYLDQSTDTFKILDDTVVTTAAGVTAGLIGDQTTATWEAGTGTTDSLVSPADVKAAVLALTPPNVIGTGSQSWRADTTRAANTWYHNNSQAAIMIQAYWSGGATVYVGPSTSSFATILQNDRDGDLDNPSYVIVPAYHYWKVSHVDHVSSSQYQNILD